MKLTRKIKKVQEDLSSKVLKEYRHPVEVSVREEPGPFGLKVIVACYPRAHPGTGMKKVLMDDEGTTYGIHGEQNLAQLAQKKDWKSSLPETQQFLKLVNIALFDGIGKFIDGDSRWSTTPQGLEFCYTRLEHPSGKKIPMTLKL